LTQPSPQQGREILPEQLIVTRIVNELREAQQVAVGQGIPQLIKPHLADSTRVFEVSDTERLPAVLDAVVLEMEEISSRGELILRFPQEQCSLNAGLWILAGRFHKPEGYTRLVENTTAQGDGLAPGHLIVTELGVLTVSEFGFKLLEVAPGVASDDVRRAVRTSLHVSDQLRVMKL
jgi:acyl CoA:acetate/3-ketoacid CoA transferase beta subunit